MGTVFRTSKRSNRPKHRIAARLPSGPIISTALNNLANVLVAQKKYDDGVRILGDTLKIYPDHVVH
jgi:hypothetical protein